MNLRKYATPQHPGIQLAPLVDVLLLLLIFFLMTWNAARNENELDVKVPKASAAKEKAGSVVTVGAEEFPSVLNMITPEGNLQWTGMIVGPALARGYRLLPDFSYEPWIFDKDCTVTAVSPFTVDCTIRPDAVWSDKKPITADDFEFTFKTIMNPKNNVVTRNGYDKIREFNVISPTEFQMVFEEIFAPYRDLWASTSTLVLPKHVLEGTNFNKVWNTCICDPKTKKPISSGPMLVQSFTPDKSATLVPNPNYWGEKKATVSKVVFIPITDSNSEVNAFRAGEVDMIYPQNQIGLRKKIEAVDGARYASTLGPQWEHFDMLSTVPGLDDIAVRKAIATALPRQQIVERVVKDANDDATVLDNTQWMTDQKAYQPNWSMYPAKGDVAAANAMLDAAGWKPGSDGVRAKDGVRLAFSLGTTSGNQARELSQVIIQEQLKQIGGLRDSGILTEEEFERARKEFGKKGEDFIGECYGLHEAFALSLKPEKSSEALKERLMSMVRERKQKG
jgi:peptide/nickel transport system substrate-binding protein